MKINKKVNGEKVVIALDGRLDTATSPELEAVLSPVTSSAKELELDFSKLEYVSSAGLRVLLTAQKAMNSHKGKMTVVHANDVVRDVFEVTGFSAFINLKK